MKSINDALEADFWTGMAAGVNTRGVIALKAIPSRICGVQSRKQPSRTELGVQSGVFQPYKHSHFEFSHYMA
jgi:hypothetical protein